MTYNIQQKAIAYLTQRLAERQSIIEAPRENAELPQHAAEENLKRLEAQADVILLGEILRAVGSVKT